MIYIRAIILIFLIFPQFWPLCPPVVIRYLSIWITVREFLTEFSFPWPCSGISCLVLIYYTVSTDSKYTLVFPAIELTINISLKCTKLSINPQVVKPMSLHLGTAAACQAWLAHRNFSFFHRNCCWGFAATSHSFFNIYCNIDLNFNLKSSYSRICADSFGRPAIGNHSNIYSTGEDVLLLTPDYNKGPN